MEVISILRRYVRLLDPPRIQKSITALQPLDQEKIHGLIAALGDNNPNIRLLVIEILAELDPIPASLPALIKALEDPDRIVRIAAVEPVARFGERAQAAVPILEEWLEDDQEYVRIAAAAAIGKIDATKIPEIMPVLLDGLKSEVHLDQLNAVAALGDLGEAGSEALPMLATMLTNKNAVTRSEAASAISQITGDPTLEITVVVALLRAVDWLDRYVAAEHLGCLGAVATPALPHLRRALADEDAAVRAMVRIAIERIKRA